MKRVFLVVIVFVVCAFLVGCGKKEKEIIDNEKSLVLGGWKINTNANALIIPQKAKNAFDKAQVDKSLTPVLLLGTQVVSGTNYMYLCISEEGFKTIVIYEDLQGNCSVTKTSDFDVSKYAHNSITNEAKELSGGWTINTDMTGSKIDSEVLDVFNDATKTITGVTYTPLIVLADQIVSGTNYAVLCIGKPSTTGNDTYIDVLTIYKNLDGESSLVSIANVDLAEYNN